MESEYPSPTLDASILYPDRQQIKYLDTLVKNINYFLKRA